MSTIYFAIGDVHGEADKLRAMHSAILDRIAFEKAPARIVHLGDYVDRGPDSRGVIEQVMAFEAMFEASERIRVVSLRGNHEQMMLDAYDGDESHNDHWWYQGGSETADSYAGGVGLADRSWRSIIPREHINWMRALPSLWRAPADGFAFVHAGIDPATYPDCDPEVRLWTRSLKFTDTAAWPEREELRDLLVIHGHTPLEFPEMDGRRINVDTGACFGGPLTAVLLKKGEEPRFIGVG